jgi:ABC-2 type transport system ATP-binding protein
MMHHPSTAIAVSALSKNFGDIIAVDNIDFSVPTGTITGLLGGNGAGKTTTIAMILGLIEPSNGRIEILGFDLARERDQIAPRMNFESPYVDMPLRLTVYQNLSVYGRLYGVKPLQDQILAIADKMDLNALLNRKVGTLSAGQKTRVGLAKALLNTPDIILLDEPTASLDPDTAHWVRGQLQSFCKKHGATILLASHNMAEVEQLCDHVLIMKAGHIVDQGSPKRLIERYGRRTMEEVFLDVVRGTAENNK